VSQVLQQEEPVNRRKDAEQGERKKKIPGDHQRAALEHAVHVIAVTIALWPLPQRTRLTVAGASLVAMLCLTHADLPDRAPVGDPYIQTTIPPIAHPDKTMVLMTGETPMGFLVPSLPSQIPVVRIDGWMIQPKDGSHLTAETRARVGRFRGDLYVVFNSFEADRNRDALKAYDLAIDARACRDIVTNLAGPYAFCPLTRLKANAS
jgi:hypothetical protein